MRLYNINRFTLFSICVICSSGLFADENLTDKKKYVHHPEKIELPVMVVTATSTDHTIYDAPASISVVTKDEIEKRPVNNVLEAIRDLEGVSLVGRGVGGRKTFSIRGMESWHTLMLIDGKRISSSNDVFGHSNFQNNWVPPAAIERIEVVRGPLSSLYGSEALGGVVNVITRIPKDKWYGNINVSGGWQEGKGGEEQSTAFWFGGPVVDWLALSVNGTKTRIPATPLIEDHSVSSLEGGKNETLGSTISLMPTPDHTIDLGFQKGKEELWRYVKTTGASPINYRSLYDIDRDHYFASYKGYVGDWIIGSKIYRSKIEQHNTNNRGVKPTNPQQLIDDVADLQVTTPLFFCISLLLAQSGVMKNSNIRI